MLSIHDKLIHTVTEYDRKQSKKRGYNIWALPQYLAAINEGVLPDINAGKIIRQALLAHLNGRLLDFCLKAVGEPKYTDAEERQTSSEFFSKIRL